VTRDMQRSTGLRLRLWIGGQICPNGTGNSFTSIYNRGKE
jgi:hypothetical protein